MKIGGFGIQQHIVKKIERKFNTVRYVIKTQ